MHTIHCELWVDMAHVDAHGWDGTSTTGNLSSCAARQQNGN
jgi:hypothetical protein